MSLKSHVFIVHLLFVCSAVFAQNTSINVDKKSDPNPIVAGSNITYTITVSTEGPDDAANATLSDTLPGGTTFVSLTNPVGWSCTTPSAGSSGTVTCSRALFAPGSDVFTLVLETDPSLAHGSILSNTATISTTTTDNDEDDNVSTSNTIVEARSDLGVTKSIAPDPAPIGGSATFTIGYSATGPSHTPNVTIGDTLPLGTFFDSVSAPGWNCGTPAVGANGAVTCTNASLFAGASGTITIGVTIDSAMAAGTTITNTATISGDIIDDNPANDSAVAGATVQHVSNLAIDKSAAPNPVTAGSPLTYTIDVTASGPSSAPGVAMNDVLPAGTTFTSLASPAGWNCATPAVGATGAVNCTHSSLASGYAGTFTLVVTVDPSVADGTTISNTSTISGNVSEATADNSSTADVTASIVSDLSVTKSAPATIFAGGSMSYSIAYIASGPSASSGVTIADALPPATTFDSISAPGFTCTTPPVGANGSVSCTAATLAPGANGTITINVTVLPATPPSTVITNTAMVTSASGDANPGNDSSTATTTVIALPITTIPTLSPLLMLAFSALLAFIGWAMAR